VRLDEYPPVEFAPAASCPPVPSLRFDTPLSRVLGSCLYCGGEVAAVGCENGDCPNAGEGLA
jgi:hypothetical protein